MLLSDRLSASANFLIELEDKLGDKEMADMGEKLGKALIELHVKNLSTVSVDWMYHHSHLNDGEVESRRSLRRREKEKRRVKLYLGQS